MSSENVHSDDETIYASDSSDSVIVILNPPSDPPHEPEVATWLKAGAPGRDKTPPRFRFANINGTHGFNRHRNW